MKHTFVFIISLFFFSVWAFPILASGMGEGTPKILNLYLDWQLPDAILPQLAKWDVVVLDADQQVRNPEKLKKLRELNPTIKLLAYVASEEISDARFSEPASFPMNILARGIQESWYAVDAHGKQASFWPGTKLINITHPGWIEYFPQFIHTTVISSGYWDGVFLDNTFDGISYFVQSPLDLNQDGIDDEKKIKDDMWRTSMQKIIRNIHTQNPAAIIMGNGGAVYASDLHGALFEKFPAWSWGPNWKEFRDSVKKNLQPSYGTINVNTSNEDRPMDFARMRFGLVSALMGDGYYSFDRGDYYHNVTWWYDEYAIVLGKPLSAPRILSPSIWTRAYTHGIVLLNSADTAQHIPLMHVYEKIHGIQDTFINNGSLVDAIDISAHDAIVLLGKSDAENIHDGMYTNGSFVRVIDGDGISRKNGFFAIREDIQTGAKILVSDFDRDGIDDVLTAHDGIISIFSSSGRKTVFRPFGPGYTGQLSIAAGNIDTNPADEIIVSRASGAPPEVAIFSLRGKKRASWFAYNKKFTGGVTVAIGDINTDGINEIVTGAGPGGGPHIRLWSPDGRMLPTEFFAFDASEIGGVSVAVGEIDSDGKREILVGSGQGSIPRIRIFSGDGFRKREIRLGDIPLSSGLQVSAADLDASGKKEIVVTGLSAF